MNGVIIAGSCVVTWSAPSPSSLTQSQHAGTGRRDRTLLLAPVLAGRRRAEVIGLRAGDLSLEAETVFHTCRVRGGKAGRRELPCPAHATIQRTLADAGKDLPTMDPIFFPSGQPGTQGNPRCGSPDSEPIIS